MQSVTVRGRETGISLTDGADSSVSCSAVLDNTTGVAVAGAATGIGLVDNHLQWNATEAVTNSAADPVDAENNFWGTADGSASDGGSGDAHSADVDAVPHSAASAACVAADHDFGDAPAPYPTRLADDGARHGDGGATLQLGTTFDNDPDGQPNPGDASGDDTLDDVDDEDGVTFTTPLIAGAPASVEVTVTDNGTAGKLNAWIDWNQDGSWAAGEQIIADLDVTPFTDTQTVTVGFPVPAGAPSGATYARFRIDSLGNLSPTGEADDGEVEDHSIVVGDGDQDGVADEVEDGAPNGGDGNGDGTADRLQGNVASLPNSADGSYLTLVSPADTELRNVRAVTNPSPVDTPSGVKFPLGFLSFAVTGVDPGGTTEVTVIFQPLAAPPTFYNFGPEPEPGDTSDHWYEFLLDGDGTGAGSITTSQLTLSLKDGGRGDSDLEANGRIANLGAPALVLTVDLTSPAQSNAESVASVTVTVQLSALSEVAVDVPLTFAGTAADPADYAASTTTITLPAGVLSADLTLTVVDDALDEGDETVVVTMGVPVNAMAGTVTVHTATILDNDPAPTVSFTANSQSNAESVTAVTATAQLSALSGKEVLVPMTFGGNAANPGDYSPSTSTLVIPAGQMSADLTLTVVDDALDEGNEIVDVAMGTPVHAGLGATTVHTAIIQDDDPPPVVGDDRGRRRAVDHRARARRSRRPRRRQLHGHVDRRRSQRRRFDQPLLRHGLERRGRHGDRQRSLRGPGRPRRRQRRLRVGHVGSPGGRRLRLRGDRRRFSRPGGGLQRRPGDRQPSAGDHRARARRYRRHRRR